MNGYIQSIGLLAVALLYIGFDAWGVSWADSFLEALLLIGLLAIGIPHGALDVWTHRHRSPGSHSSLYHHGVPLGHRFDLWRLVDFSACRPSRFPAPERLAFWAGGF